MKLITANKLNRFWKKGIDPILKLLGKSDISGIGDGTLTGAINAVNTGLKTGRVLVPAGGSVSLADAGISASGDYVLFMQSSTNHGNAASIYIIRVTGSAKIITAIYEGDSNYAPRVGSGGIVTVNGYTGADVGIACRLINL